MEFNNIVPGMTFEKEFVKALQSAQLRRFCRRAGKRSVRALTWRIWRLRLWA